MNLGLHILDVVFDPLFFLLGLTFCMGLYIIALGLFFFFLGIGITSIHSCSHCTCICFVYYLVYICYFIYFVIL